MKWLSWQSASHGSIETELDPSRPHTRAESGSLQASSRPLLARELSWISKFPVEWETLPQNEQCGWLLRNDTWDTHFHTCTHLPALVHTNIFVCLHKRKQTEILNREFFRTIFFLCFPLMDCILQLLLLTQVYRAWHLVLYSKFPQYAMMVGWLLMLGTLAFQFLPILHLQP